MVYVKILQIFGKKKKKKKETDRTGVNLMLPILMMTMTFTPRFYGGNGFPIPVMKRTLASCNLDGYRSLGHLRSPT